MATDSKALRAPFAALTTIAHVLADEKLNPDVEWLIHAGVPEAHPTAKSERTYSVLYKPAASPNLVRFAARRDAPVVCVRCGRSVLRQARQQKFCSAHCRELAKQRTRKAFLGQDTGAPPNPPQNVNGFKSLPAPKSGSSIALQAPRDVIEAEVFSGRQWRPVVSSGGVVCEVSTWRRRTLVGRDAS